MVNHPNRKLTPAVRDMLDRIRRATDGEGALLTLPILMEGGRAPGRMRMICMERWAERCDHPKIVVCEGRAAEAIRITPAGRAALTGKDA